MNKKALAILIISALGFLIATLVFYSNLGSRQPGPDSSYLGHNAMIIFQIYYEAESRLLFLDNAAIIAWKKSNDNLENFKTNFQPYLSNFNFIYGTDISIDDYEFFLKDGYLKARSDKELSISSTWYSYKFHPNFRVLVVNEIQSSNDEGSINLVVV